MDETRIQKEEEFHNKRFSGDDGLRRNAHKYYSIFDHIIKRYLDIVSQLCPGKKLLEYGCGTGSWTLEWIKNGAELTGIDISSEGIKKAKQMASENGYSAEFFVMNAEQTDFPDNSFDLIVGTGILHHLNLSGSYNELYRILKKDGHAVFLEPLGHNPFIRLYRALTPAMRTEDEHPLLIKDLNLLKKYFYNVELEYFSLSTFIAVPFRNFSFFNRLYSILQNIDKKLFALPYVGKLAWTVIIHASNPKKQDVSI